MNLTKNSNKPNGAPCGKFSWKFLLVSFISLVVYVSFSLLTSTSRLSVIVDMSIKMRSNVIGVFNSLVDLSIVEELNGNISQSAVRPTEKQPVKDSVKYIFSDDKGTILKQPLAGHVLKLLDLKSQEKNKPRPTQSFRDTYSIDQHNDNGKHSSRLITVDLQNDTDGTNINTVAKSTEIDRYGNVLNTNVNIRQKSCISCFQHDFKYVIENKEICKQNSPVANIDLLVMIFTSHKNTRARSALRSTWLSQTNNNKANVRHVFLVGETKDIVQRKAILEENQRFKDIVKEDFVDSYTNLTYKTIMGFKWAATYCAHAHYVMKTDDDMFVNIPNLLQLLQTQNSTDLQSSVIGACHKSARPIRNRKSKWFASLNSYPDKLYPGFCSGTGYVTSIRVATEVYKISPSVPFFHLEDVYVSLCIQRLGFKLKGMPGFNTGRPKLDPCLYKKGQLITAHQMTPMMLQLIWQKRCVKKP